METGRSIAMRTLVLGVFCLLCSVDPALAISRHFSNQLTCAGIKATIAREGAAIMRHDSKRADGMLLYNRYVVNRQFCRQDQETRTTLIPSADSASCAVKECFDPELEGIKGDR